MLPPKSPLVQVRVQVVVEAGMVVLVVLSLLVVVSGTACAVFVS